MVSVTSLPSCADEVANESWKAAEDRFDRQHPEVGDARLESIDDLRELAGAVLGLGCEDVLPRAGLQQTGLPPQACLLDDQLAHKVHQVVELADIDADRVGRRAAGRRRLPVGGGQHIGRRSSRPRHEAPGRRPGACRPSLAGARAGHRAQLAGRSAARTGPSRPCHASISSSDGTLASTHPVSVAAITPWSSRTRTIRRHRRRRT